MIFTPKNKFVISSFLLLFSLSGAGYCATYDVAPGSDGDCSDGKCNFQAALDAVLLNNGSSNTIRLAQGEYSGNYSYFPSGNNTGDLEILGGWNADFSSRALDPANTILNGNNAGQVLNLKLENPDNPVIIGGNLNLEGFTVKNGKAYIGGGLFAFTAAPYRIDITSCIIENNHADNAAGGCAVGVHDFVGTDTNGTLYMTNNIIRNNDVSMVGATDGNGGGCDVFVRSLLIREVRLVEEEYLLKQSQPDMAGLNHGRLGTHIFTTILFLTTLFRQPRILVTILQIKSVPPLPLRDHLY